MQYIHNSNPPMVTGVCDTNKALAQTYRNLKIFETQNEDNETNFF